MLVTKKVFADDKFPWPVDASISTNFGYPYSSSHTGEDFPCSIGTPVYAVADGTVSYYYCAKNGSILSSYGNLAILSSGSYQFYYAHLSGFAFDVETPLGNNKTYPSSGGTKHLIKGNIQVSKGQVLGYVGQAGNATGPHLHFEVRIGGTPNPPLDYLTKINVTIPTNQNPKGWLDEATGGAGTINVHGWSIDDDTPDQAVEIHIYADGPVGEGTVSGK